MNSRILWSCIGACILWLASSAQAETIYATSKADTLVRIDTTTGIGTVVGPTGTSENYGTAFSANGSTLYGIRGVGGDNRFGQYNLTTGAFTDIGGGFGVGMFSMRSLEVASTGTIYSADDQNFSESLWTVNSLTGAATAVGPLGFDGVADLAFTPSGTLWGLRGDGKLYTINTATGAGTLVTTITGTAFPIVSGISFDSAGILYATDYSQSSMLSSSLYTVNTTTGAAALIGPTGQLRVWGGDINMVPEPAFIAPLIIFGLTSRRIRRRAARD